MRFAIVVLVACGSGPRYQSSQAPPLPPAQVTDPAAVRVSFPAMSMWEATEERLALGGGDTIGADAQRIGPVRGEDRRLAFTAEYDVVCGWIDDECRGRAAARERSKTELVQALASLQRAAARAGATAIANTKCFAVGHIMNRRLWCEGDAMRDSAPPARKLEDILSHDFRVKPSAWTFAGSFTGGFFGKHPVKGTSIGLAWHTSELAFHMVAPFDDTAAALGLETLHGIRRGSMMLRAGASILFMTPLQGEMANATRGALGLEPKLALSYHLDQWRFYNGFARIFAELRGGYTFVLGAEQLNGKELGGPSIELALGFRSY